MPVCLCVCTSLTFKRDRKRASERNSIAKLEREHSVSEGECVSVLWRFCWQPCIGPPSQAIFHATTAVHTAERDNGSGVGVGVAWTAAENMADLQREGKFSCDPVRLRRTIDPFWDHLHYLKGLHGWGCKNGSRKTESGELNCRCMHMHISMERRS